MGTPAEIFHRNRPCSGLLVAECLSCQRLAGREQAPRRNVRGLLLLDRRMEEWTMPDQVKTGKEKPAKPPRDPDVYRVLLRAPDRETLARAVRQRGLDIDHSHPSREKPLEIEAFLTQAQVDDLKKEGWDLRVRENLSEIGRERQKEVGKGDRFQGGKIAPKGLGKKTAKGR